MAGAVLLANNFRKGRGVRSLNAGVVFIALAWQERSAIDDPRSLILTAAVETMTTQRVTADLAVVNAPTSDLGE